MAPVDYAIIGLYFLVVIGLGFWYRRRAAKNLESYFLGGKRLPWLVLLGIAIGLQAESIAQIWSWMMMALGAGVVIPNVLRWYWWRMNGWGYTLGTLGGIALSLVVLFFPATPVYYVSPAVCLKYTWLRNLPKSDEIK